MAKLIVETFQVCLGTDENDPNPTIFARGMLTESDAQSLRDRLLGMLSTQLDPALTIGKTFYTRQTPGAQARTIAAQTGAAVRAELAVGRFSLPLYARTLDDADGNEHFVKVRAMSSEAVR